MKKTTKIKKAWIEKYIEECQSYVKEMSDYDFIRFLNEIVSSAKKNREEKNKK